MTRSSILTFVAKLRFPLAIAAVFIAGWFFGLSPEPEEASAESKGLWTCSMHPQIRQPNPDLCPICAMDLIPLQSGDETGEGRPMRAHSVTREAAALMDLRVSPVTRAPASVHVDLFGKIAYDERNVITTTARIGGRLDRFYVDYTGTGVRKGDHIAEIYSPDLFVAQQDLIQATKGVERARKTGTPAALKTQERILNSARERLRLLQLTDLQINAIARKTTPDDHVTLFAQQDGIVTKRHVIEGAYIKTGDPLFSVASLDTLWLNLEAFESDLAWLHFAQDVAFSVDALPGKSFHGPIAYIDQELDAMRRVVRVRVNVDNSGRLLKPGMFARATVDAKATADGKVIDPGLAGKWISPMHPEVMSDSPGQCSICGMDLVPAEELGYLPDDSETARSIPLLVPVTAVLTTGKRAVVYVRTSTSPNPEFEGREIVTGPRVGDRYIVRSGLEEGEMVVSRGAFKLDSELQIKAQPSMMSPNASLIETPATEADNNLLGQWGPIPRALGRLQQAVQTHDAAAMKESILSLEATISGIQTNDFHPTTLATWNQFAPRLQNALILAGDRLSDAPTTMFRNLTRAFEEAGRYLGLPSQPELTSEPVDPGQLAALQHALTAYFLLATALAADNQAQALSSRDPLVTAVRKLSTVDQATIESLVKAADIDTLRVAFEPTTTLLIDQVKDYGKDRVGNVYVAHCPMAFDDAGADWLSSKPDILNPYFGAAMLKCGVIRENLSFDPDKVPSAEQPMHTH